MKIEYLILIYTLTPCIIFTMHVKDLSIPVTFMGKEKTLNEWLYSVDHDLAKCHKFGEGTSIIDATDMPTFHKLGNVDDLNLETINSINQGNFIYFKDIKIKDHIYYGTLVTHKNPYSIDLVEIKACYLEHRLRKNEDRLRKNLRQKLDKNNQEAPFFYDPCSAFTYEGRRNEGRTKLFYRWINRCSRYKNEIKSNDPWNRCDHFLGETQVFCSIETEPYFKKIGIIDTLNDDTLTDLKKGAYFFPNMLRGHRISRDVGVFLLAPKEKSWIYKRFFQEYYFKTLLEKSDAEKRVGLDPYNERGDSYLLLDFF